MFELALAWLGGLALGVAGTIGIALKMIRLRDEAESELTFEDVCRAAGRAKQDRIQEDHITRDFIDGADEVIAELLDAGHGDSPEEMQTAYLAGGEEPELEGADQS